MNELILRKIMEYDTIILHRHTRPDGDCMGSQMGLKKILQASFPNKEIYAVGEETNTLYFLGRVDRIDDDIYKEALVILVDVANKVRISDQRFSLAKEIIKIDHHPKIEYICDVEWIDPSYSSVCAMLVDFWLHNQDKLKMTDDAARVLYYGMVTDTLRFTTTEVSSRTFNLASALLKFNFDIQEIYQNIYSEPLNINRFRGYISQNFTCTKNGLGYMKITKEICERFNVKSNICNITVGTMSNIDEVKIWFLAFYDEFTNGRIRISLRSRGLRINQYAEKYGGSGHETASGIIVDTFEIVDQMANDLDKYLEEEESH